MQSPGEVNFARPATPHIYLHHYPSHTVGGGPACWCQHMQRHRDSVSVHECHKRRSEVKSENLFCTCHFYPLLSPKIRCKPAISCCFKVRTCIVIWTVEETGFPLQWNSSFALHVFLCLNLSNCPCLFVPTPNQRKVYLVCQKCTVQWTFFPLSLKSEYIFSFVAFLNSLNMPEPEVKL